MQGAGGTRTLSHYGPGRDWVRRCVAVCGRPIIEQSVRSAKHSEYWAGLRAREGLLMFSALPQQPWPPNSRSCHPPARADQTSRWPARRPWQKGGQVLEVWLAPILVPTLHPNPFVTLSQPLFCGRCLLLLTLRWCVVRLGARLGPELGRNFRWAAELERG